MNKRVISTVVAAVVAICILAVTAWRTLGPKPLPRASSAAEGSSSTSTTVATAGAWASGHPFIQGTAPSLMVGLDIELAMATLRPRFEQAAAQAGAGREAAEAVEQVLRGVVAPTLEDFNAVLAGMGVEPWGEGMSAAEWTQRRMALLAGLRVQPEGIRGRSTPGTSLGQLPPGWAVRESSRDQARPSELMSQTGTSKFEMLVPVQVRDARGKDAQTVMGLEFWWDGRAQKWVWVRSRMYGTPPGSPIPPWPI